MKLLIQAIRFAKTTLILPKKKISDYEYRIGSNPSQPDKELSIELREYTCVMFWHLWMQFHPDLVPDPCQGASDEERRGVVQELAKTAQECLDDFLRFIAG